MLKKLLTPMFALCLLVAFPVQAGRFCPYHWYLALAAAVSAGEAIIVANPEYRRHVRVAEGVAVAGIVAYVVKATMDSQKPQAENEVKTLPAPEQKS